VTTTTVPGTTTTIANTTTTTLPDDQKVPICHATGSASNPFVFIEPSAAGVWNGHIDHQHMEDIIPPFTYNGVFFPGQNYDPATWPAIVASGNCAPTTTTTVPVTTTTVVNPDLTLCHATGSETEPYVKLTLPADEAFNDHFLVDADDIFPPFTYNGTSYPGLNWTDENQVTYADDCVPPLGTTIVNTTTTTSVINTTTTTIPDTTTTTEPDTVLPTQVTQPGGMGKPHPSKPVLPRRNPPDRVLPFTGSDPSPFIGMAGVLMAVGGSLVLASRRRRLGY
jgi:LPXTG-motif cell wall-anchored protein